VRVDHNRSLAEVNGTMESLHLGDGPRADDRAREVVVQCGGGASSSSGWRCGKV
jgi:hypothetical protein